MRTNGGGLDHVADRESFDRLVLGRASGAVGASDGLHVAAALLVATAGRASVIPPDPAIHWIPRTWMPVS